MIQSYTKYKQFHFLIVAKENGKAERLGLSALCSRRKVPRNNEKHLMMQNVHLVVTYEDGNTWKLFMPDCIRTILRDTTESQIGYIPGMMEYRKVLESLTECNIKLQEVMDREAGKVPMSQASKLILNQLEKQYIKKREELRKIQAKYSWASEKKNPVQQSIADALMYIGFMKLV